MKEQKNEVKTQVAGTISNLLTVAFGLIAALAWNSHTGNYCLSIAKRKRYNGFTNLCNCYHNNCCNCYHSNCQSSWQTTSYRSQDS